ncbi:Protein FAM49A [Takifugu flavidus]|nr:Protein FAM49A [Takifugu flavidus]
MQRAACVERVGETAMFEMTENEKCEADKNTQRERSLHQSAGRAVFAASLDSLPKRRNLGPRDGEPPPDHQGGLSLCALNIHYSRTTLVCPQHRDLRKDSIFPSVQDGSASPTCTRCSPNRCLLTSHTDSQGAAEEVKADSCVDFAAEIHAVLRGRSPAMGNLIKVLGKDLENCPHFFLDFESKGLMGNLLKVLACTELEHGPIVFLDFEHAQPTEAETAVWNQVSAVLEEAHGILAELQSYNGAGQEIREAIQNPGDLALQEKAWNAVCPLVAKLKRFYEFSLRLGEDGSYTVGMVTSGDAAHSEVLEGRDEGRRGSGLAVSEHIAGCSSLCGDIIMASPPSTQHPDPAARQPLLGKLRYMIVQQRDCSGRDDVCCVAAESGEKVTESRPPFTVTDKGYDLKNALRSLLEALTSPPYAPMQHLEREQALAKQFAEILHFTLSFDELKMTNPAIQNDFSYYRRTISRNRLNNQQLEAENEVNNEMANRMSLFYAEATPMLKTLSNATTKFVSENKTLPIEDTTDCLSTMACVCRVMLETPEYRCRFTNTDTMLFCMRVMVGVIILYDHVHPVGAFAKTSKIDMKGCIKVLKEQPSNSVEGLLNALRYTTRHLNDDSTSKQIRALLQ